MGDQQYLFRNQLPLLQSQSHSTCIIPPLSPVCLDDRRIIEGIELAAVKPLCVRQSDIDVDGMMAVSGRE